MGSDCGVSVIGVLYVACFDQLYRGSGHKKRAVNASLHLLPFYLVGAESRTRTLSTGAASDGFERKLISALILWRVNLP
jgi:hypothetical protein